MDIDVTVRALFDKLNARKQKISELKAQIEKSWKTNCSIRLIGATTPTNIQTATVELVEEVATQLCMVESARRTAAVRLDRPVNMSVQGHTIDHWFEDLQKRLAVINVREEEKQLEQLEQRLNQVLSPEERRRIEVELLARELNG